MALRDDFQLYLALKLKGKRERTYDKWFAQANAFYSLALEKPEIQEAMSYPLIVNLFFVIFYFLILTFLPYFKSAL